ncbi:hypothetical protein G9F72_012005 [Clostridium estertheticum]|uniref:hypothetical protein n=1 Tax=Clostridium estertheticum TaxID=238834 RepID=UPI0013E93F2C|nr:hypothetical protein [Clostridium estertheticum]MBZ9687047.1 hypothetical protein [Clostridium estertheticum]
MVDIKSMSNKKKAEYIWEYYKLHIIGVLAVIFIIASIIHGQITKIDYVFNLTLVGNNIDENKKTEVEKQLGSIVIKEGEGKKQALMDVIPLEGSSKANASMSSASTQKFIAKISVGEIDVVILDKGMAQTYAKQDMFSRLDNIKELDLAGIKNEKIEATGSDNIKAVYAINAENIKILKDTGFDTENMVIAIISSCKQKDKAATVIKWLLNK